MGKRLGIEIGHTRVKIAYMERGQLKQYLSERIDSESIRDPESCAEVIREILQESGIRCKNAVFVLRHEDTYVKRIQLPLMTVHQLELNLPYEFHDYVGDAAEEYQFDYAVLGHSEEELDILAAACRKDLCRKLQMLSKNAGIKMIGLVPEVIGLERILEHAEDRDYAVADLGYKTIRIHFFHKGIYDTTRTMDMGCVVLEAFENAHWEEDMKEFCRSIAAQIMRALNFYCYINGENAIDSLYCCGGGIQYKILLETIEKTLEIPVKTIGELFKECGTAEVSGWTDSPQTFGVLLK